MIDEEDYQSSPFHPTPIKRNRRHSISTTPLKVQSHVEPHLSLLEDEEENEVIRRRGERNEKGYKKAEEFRNYLNGERSARDPRFDLKVFQYVPSFPLPLLSSACSSSSSSPSFPSDCSSGFPPSRYITLSPDSIARERC
jgi:hypothetical protein